MRRSENIIDCVIIKYTGCNPSLSFHSQPDHPSHYAYGYGVPHNQFGSVRDIFSIFTLLFLLLLLETRMSVYYNTI
jgi:hypothetical protein